jgi:hypothetical protein
MNDLAQYSTTFNDIPPSPAANTSFWGPASDRERGDSNGTNPFENIPSGRPTSARRSTVYGHSAEPNSASSSPELPRAQPCYLASRRSTESLAQNQRPSLGTTPRNTSGVPSPNQPSTYHSAGPVNQFDPWVGLADPHPTASLDEIVEMDGSSFPVRPLSAVSTYPPVRAPESNNTYGEPLRRPLFRSLDWAHTSEMPTDTALSNPNPAPAIPPKISHDRATHQIEDPTPSRAEEMCSPTFSEAMQPFDQASSPENTPVGPSRTNARGNSTPTTS